MTISFKVSDNTKNKMLKYFEDKKRLKTPAYALFQADEEDTVVTLYTSGKAVFQGISADVDAMMWKQFEQKLNPGMEVVEKNSEEKKVRLEKVELVIDKKIYFSNSIGSDEVGTGDYFGPIVVTSAYVKKDDIAWLEQLGVKDSKKLTDDKIMEIVPEIIKRIPYESKILSNSDYNNHYSQDVNMNKIKAILHNKVLLALTSHNYPTDYVIIDQFAEKYVYYNYLKDSPNVFRQITFLTKGEDRSLSVACASLISRYIFVKEMDKLSKLIGVNLPKGASDKVDEIAHQIITKYGFDKLKEVAKINFKNTERAKNYHKEKI